jgi:serine/threonine-protein kinase RsbT
MQPVKAVQVKNTPNSAVSFHARNPAEAPDGICLSVKSNHDIIHARQRARELAGRLGFSIFDLTLIATAISELARNIVLYTEGGEIAMKTMCQEGGNGFMAVARDQGPGIPCVARALQEGFSTSGGLGLGLPSVRRVMDTFELESEVNRGTMVTIKKWTIPSSEQGSRPIGG